ncbi:MAG: 50S ribosomal protein L29 [Desulfurococcales archaeon]|nr:50S ribosomal protein L29 [Desulfurococcales archaeon]
MKKWEIKKMSKEERLKKLEELRLELISLRSKARYGAPENPGKIRSIRKDIARILTYNRMEELKKTTQ